MNDLSQSPNKDKKESEGNSTDASSGSVEEKEVVFKSGAKVHAKNTGHERATGYGEGSQNHLHLDDHDRVSLGVQCDSDDILGALNVLD